MRKSSGLSAIEFVVVLIILGVSRLCCITKIYQL